MDEPAEALGAKEGGGFDSVTDRCKLRELVLREATGIRWVDGPATCDWEVEGRVTIGVVEPFLAAKVDEEEVAACAGWE